MTELILENSILWLLPIALVAALVSWYLYFRGNTFTTLQRRILSVLRFLVFFLLGFLLLSPLLKSSKVREEKPILIWLEDHSKSMLSAGDSDVVKSNLNSYKIPGAISGKYDIKSFDFSENVIESTDSFSGLWTDLYEALQESSEKFYNQNVGALVLHSDGIYNRGGNPSYVARGLPFPVFAMGYGDTTLQKDIFIERVISNRVSYLNNNMPVEVYLRARQLEGNSFKLRVNDLKGTLLYSKNFNINSADYFERVNFYLKAEKVGIQRYVVSVDELQNEVNTTNNRSTFSVEVLDNKKKIHIVGRGPHPDIGALNESLKQLERYEVKTYLSADWDKNVSDADLYVLHNPNESTLQSFKSAKKPVWIIYGPNTSPAGFKDITGVQTERGDFEEVYPLEAGDFSLFKLDDSYPLDLREMPPLQAPFGEITAEKPVYSLFTKKIGSVSTSSPLWFFMDQGNQRFSITLGTGLWRWRIYDFKENDNHEAFDRLISKVVQYLTTDARKQRFAIDMPDRLEQGKMLRAEARLYNKALELTNEPELKIVLKSEDGAEYEFSFSKDQNTYSLNAGRLPEGSYTYNSSVTLGDETFTRNGSLVIEKSYLEQADLVARHHVLRKIASESEGAFFHSNDMNGLMKALEENGNAQTYTYQEFSTENLINEKWLFALLVLFLSLEWGLRKYFGSY